MSKDTAISHALDHFDDQQAGYFSALADLVAIPTESQNPKRLPELKTYLSEAMQPAFEGIGYTCVIYDNPLPGQGPVLLATRIEDPALPTIISYGHGDVVLGMEGRWAEDRDPWRIEHDGDRVYGRGVADNKGQHLAQIVALRAVLKTRGQLGFNHKFLIETGEENGSKGLKEIVEANMSDFAADAFFASDGPRTEISKPNITLGNRGCCNFNLVVELREGGHHSGNWGGLLANPAIILSHALAAIADNKGKILVDGWRPDIPDYMHEALSGIDRDGGSSAPDIDDDWGEPGLTRIEKIAAWNTFEVLAFTAGNPAQPVNAVPPQARATCQLRYVDGTDEDRIVEHLRTHLDARGYGQVRIDPPPASNDGRFYSSRTNPNHPWAQWVKSAVERGSNHTCGVLPNSGGSNMTSIIQYVLEAPVTWMPLSYAGCSQHAPDEHILKPLMREGLRLITGVYWDLGDEMTGYRL